MLPLHAREAPVTRASTPGRPAGSSHLFTQRISSRALSMEGHLGSLQRATAGLKKGHSPPPVSKQCRTRALTQGPVRHVARKPSPLAVVPILAGDTPTGKHHQPLNAHHQERTSRGWTLPRRARGQLSHQVYVHGARPAPEPPQLGRVHVVPGSAEALAQAQGGQADLEQTACPWVCPALSPPGLPAPASKACG